MSEVFRGGIGEAPEKLAEEEDLQLRASAEGGAVEERAERLEDGVRIVLLQVPQGSLANVAFDAIGEAPLLGTVLVSRLPSRSGTNCQILRAARVG